MISPDLARMKIVNRKPRYEYEFLQTVEAGLQLTGTEVNHEVPSVADLLV
jgi:tmRNA-binding protein